MLSIKYLICILLFSGTTLLAQNNKIDSLNTLLSTATESEKAKLYAELSFYYKTEPEKRLEYINKSLELADKYDDAKSKVLALLSLSYYYLNKKMFSKADSIGKINLQISLKTLDSLSISYAYSFYGDYNFWQADYNNALIYYKKALDFNPAQLTQRQYNLMKLYAISLNNISNYAEAMQYLLKVIKYYEDNYPYDSELAHIYNVLAGIFMEMDDYESSKKYYKKSLNLPDSVNTDFTRAENFLGIAQIYTKIQKLDSTKFYLQLASKYAEKSNHQILIADINTELGDLYLEMNKPDSAAVFYNKVIKIAEEQGDNWAFVYGNLGLAKIHSKKQNYGKALFYLYKVEPKAQQVNANELLIDYYKVFANTLALSGNFREAYYYMKLYNKASDSYYKEKSAKELANLKIRYETEKKEQENKRLQMENEFKEQNLKNQHYINIAIISLLILALLFALSVFKSKRKIQQANKLLKEKNAEIINQNEEITVQSEEISEAYKKLKELNEYKQGLSDMIIHDLKNPLSIILNLAENTLVKEAANKMFLLVSDILDVSKLEEAKLVLNKQNVLLSEIVNNSIQMTEFSANISGVEIINNIPDKLYVFVDKDITIRILTNLISNAIKFSPRGSKIILDAHETKNGEVNVSVTDFGTGIPEQEIDYIFDKFVQFKAVNSETTRSTGLGLTFCKLAVEAQGGKIKVESSVNAGSVFSFTLPKGENVE